MEPIYCRVAENHPALRYLLVNAQPMTVEQAEAFPIALNTRVHTALGDGVVLVLEFMPLLPEEVPDAGAASKNTRYGVRLDKEQLPAFKFNTLYFRPQEVEPL